MGFNLNNKDMDNVYDFGRFNLLIVAQLLGRRFIDISIERVFKAKEKKSHLGNGREVCDFFRLGF